VLGFDEWNDTSIPVLPRFTIHIPNTRGVESKRII
jgi:hypothetical protein